MAYTYERYERAFEYNNTRFDKKRTKKAMCLEYLKLYDSITPLEALTAFDSFRLAALICELRKEGHEIRMEINDCEPRFAIYTLVKEDK